MAVNLGSTSAVFRVGSGSPSKVFLGTVSIQNVPGAPTITAATSELDDGNYAHVIAFIPPADGGSPITGYRVYLDDVLVESSAQSSTAQEAAPVPAPADDAQISAVNAVGEGPKSAVVSVTPL